MSPHWVILSRPTELSVVIVVCATYFVLTLLSAARTGDWP